MGSGRPALGGGTAGRRADLEVGRQVLLYHIRILHGAVSLHHLALPVNEKLSEVPLYCIAQGASSFGLVLHPLPERVSIVPVHIDLAEHVELYPVARSKRFDLSVVPGFLLPKLVAGKAEDT